MEKIVFTQGTKMVAGTEASLPISSSQVRSDLSTQDTETPPSRIVWKAFIQKPIRLGEEESLPTGRPGFFGSEAPPVVLPETMGGNVQLYKTILPPPNRQGRRSRVSVSARSVYGYLPGHRGFRFLKTIPRRIQTFPPLRRSSQFEQFLKCQQVENETTTSESTYDAIRTSINRRSRTETVRTFESDALMSQLDTATITELKSHLSDASHLKFRKSSMLDGDKIHRHVSFASDNEQLSQRDTIVQFETMEEEERDKKAQAPGPDDGSHSRRSNKVSFKSFTCRSLSRAWHFSKERPSVIDLDEFFPGQLILDSKIREYDLNLPMKCKERERMRKLYGVTILNEPCLKNLLTGKRLDALPKALRHLVRMGPIDKDKAETDTQPPVTGTAEWLQKQYCISERTHPEIALADVENLWMEAKIFTSQLFTNWMEQMRPDKSHGQLSINDFELLLKVITRDIRSDGTLPTSRARSELCNVLATCVAFPKHLRTLWSLMTEWLECLLSGLYSRERTVREETCYTLAYIFTEPHLAEGIRRNTMLDVGYDVTTAVLNAMQVNPSSFLHYFCLLALMVEGCPMYSILDAIMESGPTSGCVLLNHLWPRLIYYALRFWSSKQFSRDRLLLKHLNNNIERAYVRGISKKNAKLAQIQLSRRFRLLTRPTTIWLDEWKKYRL